MELRLENLTKKFGDLVAVNDLSLTVDEGEIISLLGPSGCGKTTTLNMIAGFERPNEGRIYFNNTLMNDVHPKDRNVGMVFQEYAIFTTMTVFQNISFGLRVRGELNKREIRAEVERIAETLHIEKLLNRYVAHLNLSELQRVALARTISVKPSILLLDEPLSNLDAALRERTRVELKRFHDQWGITMIYVTHDQLEAISLAKRIAVMNKGKLLQCDTSDAIYTHPANLFVARFIGSPPSNVITGNVTRRNGSYYFIRQKLELDISAHRRTIAEALEKEELSISFHAEDVFVQKSRDTHHTIPANVYAVELLGYDQILDLKVDDVIIRALTSANFGIQHDETVYINVPVNKINLYDTKSEENLLFSSG